MKYHESDKYNDLVKYYRYKGRVPEATRNDFEIAQRIKEKGIVGTIRVPAAKIDVSNISVVNNHAFRHGCTLEDTKKYIQNAKVSITRSKRDGLHTNFYSLDGAAYIDALGNINTIYSKNNFNKDTPKILKEVQ